MLLKLVLLDFTTTSSVTFGVTGFVYVLSFVDTGGDVGAVSR